MTRISVLTLVLALGLSASAYAQAPAGKPAQALRSDYQTLDTDDDEIRALDHKRDDALRANNLNAAKQLQAQIDSLRAARKKIQRDIGKEKAEIAQQRLTDEEKCARDPACAARKKHEELERQLQSYKQQLAADQAAAARVTQDKAAIASLENQLKK